MAENEESVELQSLSAEHLKLIASLGEDGEEETPAAEAPAAKSEEKPAETPAQTPAPKADEPQEKKEETPPATPPATPTPPADPRFDDLAKALQKVQQTTQALERKLEANGTLNSKEQRQLDQAREEAGKIEDDLADIRGIADRKREDGDVYAEGPALAKTVLKLAEKQKALEDENAAIKKELAGRKTADTTKDAAEFWKSEPAGAQKIWDDSLKDAATRPAIKRAAAMVETQRLTTEEYDQMLLEEASALYHDRKKTAKKEEPAPPPNPALTAQRVPPKTPGGASVQVQQGSAPEKTMTTEERTLVAVEKYLAY